MHKDTNFTPRMSNGPDQLPHQSRSAPFSSLNIHFFLTPPTHVSILTDNDDIGMLDSSSIWHKEGEEEERRRMRGGGRIREEQITCVLS